MNSTKILSFDPASVRNLGWSIIQVQEKKKEDSFSCIAGTIVIDNVESPWEALWPIFVAVDTILEIQKPDHVVIEKTSSFAGGFVTGQVSNCMGCILACCGKHGVDVNFVYPTHVKKVVTGKGRATKGQMKKSVKQMIKDLTGEDVKFDSEHSSDATANILCWMIDEGITKDDADE